MEIMVILDVNNVQLDSSLRRDLGADSLDEIQILHGIEEFFGANFDEICIYRVTTVRDIVEMADELSNVKGAANSSEMKTMTESQKYVNLMKRMEHAENSAKEPLSSVSKRRFVQVVAWLEIMGKRVETTFEVESPWACPGACPALQRQTDQAVASGVFQSHAKSGFTVAPISDTNVKLSPPVDGNRES